MRVGFATRLLSQPEASVFVPPCIPISRTEDQSLRHGSSSGRAHAAIQRHQSSGFRRADPASVQETGEGFHVRRLLAWLSSRYSIISGLDRPRRQNPRPDRKSTRLNSSHLGISYAVFCLKKKTNLTTTLHIYT